MKRCFRSWVAALCALALLLPYVPQSAVAAGADYVLPVFETSDVHGYLVDAGYDDPAEYQYRLAYIADKVSDARQGDAGRTILLDGGDIYQGNVLSNLQKGWPMVAAYETMAYDAVGLGNHEFDWDVTTTTDPDGTMPAYTLGELSGDSLIPVLSCNLYEKATGQRVPFTQDYVILQKTAVTDDGQTLPVNVAVVGYVTNYASSIMASAIDPYTIRANVSLAEDLAQSLKRSGQADAVILLAHADAASLASQLPSDTAVDLVCGGHTHVSQAGTLGSVSYVEPTCYGQAYGYAELRFTADKQLTVTGAQAVSVTDQADKLTNDPANAQELDSQVLLLSQTALAGVESELNAVLGYITVPISKDSIDGNIMSSTAGNWMTDLANRATGSQVSFTNNGGIRAEFSLTDGTRKITKGDVYTIAPFCNRLYVYDVTYGQLLEILNYAIGSGRGLALRMSGIDCYYSSGIVTALVEDGQCIYKNSSWAGDKKNQIIRISTNEYVATASSTPFVALNDTEAFVTSAYVDNESFIQALEAELAQSGGPLYVDDQAHFITGVYTGPLDGDQYYTITTTAGQGGTISPTQSVLSGSDATVTITPDPGYTIASFRVDGMARTPQETFTFSNVQRDHTLAVTFAQDSACAHERTQVENAQPATCTAPGYTGDTVCLLCSQVVATGQAIAALGHAYEGQIHAPTLTGQGYTQYTCTRCGDTYEDDVVPALTPWQVYTDIQPQTWYADGVCYVCAGGLYLGTGKTTFSPHLPMTRAMLVTVLWRLAGSPEATKASPYADVPAGSWYAQAVHWAWEKDVVKGTSANSFSPEDPVTREQIAVFLARYAAKVDGLSPLSEQPLSGFADAAEASSWAEDSLSWAAEQRILQGKGQTDILAPQAQASRAEVAVMLQRYGLLHEAS